MITREVPKKLYNLFMDGLYSSLPLGVNGVYAEIERDGIENVRFKTYQGYASLTAIHESRLVRVTIEGDGTARIVPVLDEVVASRAYYVPLKIVSE